MGWNGEKIWEAKILESLDHPNLICPRLEQFVKFVDGMVSKVYRLFFSLKDEALLFPKVSLDLADGSS